MLRLNEHDYKELTYEETLARYDNYLKKKIYALYSYAQKKYYQHTFLFEIEDVKQNAYIGVLKAYENYDIERNIAFFNYMDNMVVGECLRDFRDASLSRRKVNSSQFRLTSFDKEIQNNKGEAPILLAGVVADSNDYIEEFETKDHIKDMLSNLDERERKIIELRFFKQNTQVEIATMLNITQVQVSRLEKKSLIKLRNCEEKKIQRCKNRKLYKVKEIINMKIDIEQVIKYLRENANKTIAISKMIKIYATEIGCSPSSIFMAFSNNDRKEEYEELKKLYKTTNIIAPSKIKKQSTATPKIDIDTLEEGFIKALEVGGEILRKPSIIMDTIPGGVELEHEPIETVTLLNADLFKDVKIKNLTISLTNFDVEFVEDGVKFFEKAGEEDLDEVVLSIEDLETMKLDIDKIIGIRKAIY